MKSKIILLILTLSAVLRLYKLGDIPISLNWDEVSNGYNAYSILKTAKDEYGNFLPLSNRSFDDYKPPLYMYLAVPSIAVFGLNEFAYRFPSAFIGSATSILIYFLTLRVTRSKKTSLLSVLFFAISPWSLHFSRVGFEANIALFFTLGAFTSLLYSLNGDQAGLKKKLLLILSAIFFGFSFYSYHSARLFIPIMLLITLVIYNRQCFKLEKKTIVSFFLFIAIITTPLFLTSYNTIAKRLAATSQKARIEDIDKSVGLIVEDKVFNQQFPQVIHNRRVVIAISTFQKYLSHLDINFLFTTGDDNLRHHIKNHGLLYIFQLPLILGGIYVSLKNRSKEGTFLLSWLLVSPLPSAFGDAFPHAIRSFSMVVPLIIFSALGMNRLIHKVIYQKVVSTFFVIVVFAFILNFTHNYFIHYPKEDSAWWQYGYKEAVIESSKLSRQYNRIIIDSSIEQAYIFWLFYTKRDPLNYQSQDNRNKFDNFYFNEKEVKKGDLFVSTTTHFPQNINLIKTIKYPDGTEAIKIGVAN